MTNQTTIYHKESNKGILWLQVIALTVIQGAISLSWLVYRFFLPPLLTGFGFPGLAPSILILEDFLTTIIEPISGTYSDHTKKFMGTRFPIIAMGIIASSVFFIVVPGIFILGKGVEVLKWVFLTVLILWSVAMALFRTPAMSLLGQYAKPEELPQASSLIVFAGLIISSVRPVSTEFLKSLGPGLAFFIASIVLLISIAILKAVDPHRSQSESSLPDPNLPEELPKKLSIQTRILLFIMGVSISWGMRWLMGILPGVFKKQLLGINTDDLMFIIGVILAIAVFPCGLLAKKWGNNKLMLIGAMISGVFLLIFGFSKGQMVFPLAIIMVVGLSLVLNGVFPFVLSLVPKQKSGLGIGLYFGGFALSGSLFNLFFPDLKIIPPLNGAILGAIAFLIASCCIFLSIKSQNHTESVT